MKEVKECREGYDPMDCPMESTSLEDEDGMIWFYECTKCKLTFNEYSNRH